MPDSGLYKKANLLLDKGLAFLNFTKLYNLNKCALLTKNNNFFYISNSIGFDVLSLYKSKSTSDFWTGLIPENNKIYTFNKSDYSTSPLFQLFSEDIVYEIQFVNILKQGDSILLIINQNIDRFILEKFSFNEVSAISAPIISEKKYTKLTIKLTKSRITGDLELLKRVNTSLCSLIKNYFNYKVLIHSNNFYEFQVLVCQNIIQEIEDNQNLITKAVSSFFNLNENDLLMEIKEESSDILNKVEWWKVN